MTRRTWLLGALALAAVPATGCDRGTPLADRELTVACGLCRFQVPGAHRCYWAAELDGKHVAVTGPGVPTDHDAHGPEGMCVVERRARISGTLHDDKIVADRFELLPYDGPVSEVDPHDHEH